ncbi:hypothetical protein B0I37DRAFT_425230 [Chaetomium sp. MPI-CAGE-AT-0009]|nr:hypothetical protein B0I37DRAFT_425230 [Chaetomium sp. MPI-CAGE-AT-0009]
MSVVNVKAGGPRRDMSVLLAICRLNIVNPEAAATNLVRKLAAERNHQSDEVLTLRAGEPEFFSLLGTQNGKGGVRMLAAYLTMFGRKVITSALVTYGRSLNICWMLEQVENVPVAVVESREARKSERRRLQRLERTD